MCLIKETLTDCFLFPWTQRGGVFLAWTHNFPFTNSPRRLSSPRTKQFVRNQTHTAWRASPSPVDQHLKACTRTCTSSPRRRQSKPTYPFQIRYEWHFVTLTVTWWNSSSPERDCSCSWTARLRIQPGTSSSGLNGMIPAANLSTLQTRPAHFHPMSMLPASWNSPWTLTHHANGAGMSHPAKLRETPTTMRMKMRIGCRSISLTSHIPRDTPCLVISFAHLQLQQRSRVFPSPRDVQAQVVPPRQTDKQNNPSYSYRKHLQITSSIRIAPLQAATTDAKARLDCRLDWIVDPSFLLTLYDHMYNPACNTWHSSIVTATMQNVWMNMWMNQFNICIINSFRGLVTTSAIPRSCPTCTLYFALMNCTFRNVSPFLGTLTNSNIQNTYCNYVIYQLLLFIKCLINRR